MNREAPARQARPVTITACPDGPLLVRGHLELVGDDGRPVQPSRTTFALCRCGVSTIKPYCDGTHKVVGFRTTEPEEPAR